MNLELIQRTLAIPCKEAQPQKQLLKVPSKHGMSLGHNLCSNHLKEFSVNQKDQFFSKTVQAEFSIATKTINTSSQFSEEMKAPSLSTKAHLTDTRLVLFQDSTSPWSPDTKPDIIKESSSLAPFKCAVIKQCLQTETQHLVQSNHLQTSFSAPKWSNGTFKNAVS